MTWPLLRFSLFQLYCISAIRVRRFHAFAPVCLAGQMAAPLGADAGAVVAGAFGLPADLPGSLRRRSRSDHQQDQVGVWEADQSGARGGGPHQGGASVPTRSICFGWFEMHVFKNSYPRFLAMQMLDEGLLNLNHSEEALFQYDVQPEMVESVMKDYTLLSCFKKDAHKMEAFLKLLKCRQTEIYNCS